MNKQSQWLFEVAPTLNASPAYSLSDLRHPEVNTEWELETVRLPLPVPACPASGRTIRKVIGGFPRYQQSVHSLAKSEQSKINRIAHLVIRSYNPGCQPIRSIQLVGHADHDTQRGVSFERKISGDRALEIQNALTNAINRLSRLQVGLPQSSAFSTQITWNRVPMGATQRLVANPRTEIERSRNRRVEILLSTARSPKATPTPHRFSTYTTSEYAKVSSRRHCPRQSSPRPAVTSSPLNPDQQQALTNLTPLASRAITPTVGNELAIMRSLCRFHSLPLAVPYVVLDQECGAGDKCFQHPDGVMQTTSGARNAAIATLPRALKLTLLELALTDQTSDADLTHRVKAEFSQRLAVQIATGVQILVNNLREFNGYVALTYIAYNAGAGWANHVATRGRSQVRPISVSEAQWEEMCRYGASLLHKPPSALAILTGRWKCDKNIPAWFREVPVRDPQENIQLVAYQYLRSIRECIRAQKPQTPCDAANHGKREDGSGQLVCRNSNFGVLDKLYNPILLKPAFFNAAQTNLLQIPEDDLPLKVLANGRLAKMSLMSTSP